ncbi:small integral membrane protein 3 [Falco cherrug]|uniref:small integral membrane protein 3 n=1 Tax=Falco cherrug TaxID=345164 RepID=UPI002479F323|nr:small integral membrane protein 3 [Falco cherrug]
MSRSPLSWCKKKVLPARPPFSRPPSPAAPRGPGRAGRGQADAPSPGRVLPLPPPRAGAGAGQRRRMDFSDSASPAALPKHILDIWVIVLIILATILIMTAMVLCPATAVIIYRVRTHPMRNGIV